VHEDFSLDEFCHMAYGPNVDRHLLCRCRAAIESASAVLFVSDATLERLCGDGSRERFVRLDPGIALDALRTARDRLDRATLRATHGFAPDESLLLCVATVESRKSQSTLVTALARLSPEYPTARLVLVGADSSAYADALHQHVEALGVADRVTMVDATTDVMPWYAMADGFVLASDFESLPRSIMEAMAFGLPVVATSVAGTPTLVEDGVTGFLCRPRDVADLTSALRRLLQTTGDERSAMGAAARARAEGMSDERYIGTIHRLLRGLTDGPGA
jgi:glycosyltransferase involved in cell wall biosynthesis